MTTHCKWCGKPLKQKRGGKEKQYCNPRCRQKAYREREKAKALNLTEDPYLKYLKNKQEDYNNRFKESGFNQNDKNWGLGESNLSEHAAGDKMIEHYYIKNEIKRLMKRKS